MLHGDGSAAWPARLTFLTLLLLFSCTSSSPRTEDDMTERPPIEEVLERRTPELMRIPGVEGVGQALCGAEPCIRVYLRSEAVRASVPRRLDGFEVSAVVTGTVRPFTGE